MGVLWVFRLERLENNYRLLVKFQKRKGHWNVPQGHIEEGHTLGQWLKKQRQQKKKGKLE